MHAISRLNEAGINGIGYKNGVPDYSPVAKAQIKVDYMLGGKVQKEMLLEVIILSEQMKD